MDLTLDLTDLNVPFLYLYFIATGAAVCGGCESPIVVGRTISVCLR